ncbi:MAG TPA: sulfide-dependent adenosine diphosphate thiazole synthase [Sulfolobales archaeon]|nr:sulfide-dependent adenosine diphosphate thiazole synthase [Sulfolobales archaeon]
MASKRIFAEVSEADITSAIIEEFNNLIKEYSRSDVIIVGGGPAGLTAAWKLALRGLKTLIIEQNNYLGGGIWMGGYLMNPVTFRAPAHKVLEELGIPYKEYKRNLYVAHGPLVASKLASKALEAGARALTLTILDDLIVRNGRVEGVVVNSAPVQGMPRQITCLDPIGLEAKVVIDATGHEAAAVRKLASRGLIKSQILGPMWAEASEDLVVEHTGEVFPGLVVAGISVAEHYGLPRMGPTFGAMLLSGEKAAEIAYQVVTGRKG